MSGGIIPSFLTHREDCKRKEVYLAEETEQFKLISFSNMIIVLGEFLKLSPRKKHLYLLEQLGQSFKLITV